MPRKSGNIEKIKIGIIGCGEISQIMHIPFIKEMENQYELVALCDMSKKLLDKLSRKYQVKNIFLDYEDMLNMKDIDAVLVATYDHAEIVKKFAQNKVHIFVEKPIAFTVSEANDMIEVCKQNEVKLMVGYMKLFEPSFKHAKEEFKRIDYKLVRIHDYMHYNSLITREIYSIFKFNDVNFNRIEWLNKIALSRISQELDCMNADLIIPYFFLLMGGIHDISVLTELFGIPEKILVTDIWQHEEKDLEVGENDLGIFGNYIISILDYGRNKRCIIELGGTAKKWMDEEIVAYGTKETIEFSFGSPYIKNFPAILKKTFMNNNEIHKLIINTSYEEAFKLELKHFYDCIVNDKVPFTNGEKARRDLELIQAIMKRYLEFKVN